MNALCKAGALALVALLTGCAGVTTSFADITRHYRPSELGFNAGSDGTFRVVVIGNPFDVSKETFETAIVTEMTGSTLGGPRLAFSTAPDEADRRNHRVVLVFDPPEKRSYLGLCAPRVAAGAPASAGRGEVRVLAAFCQGETLITGVSGRARDVTGPRSPNFGFLVRQTTMSLFPSRNPELEENRCPPWPLKCN
jgi:hypothetical protein